MRFILNNIAKVAKGEIEVNGITVIAGYNDTGKTTILRSVNVLLQTFINMASNIETERKKSVRIHLIKKGIVFDSNGFEEMPEDLLYDLAGKVSEHTKKDRSMTPEIFKTLYESVMENYQLFYQEIPDHEKMFSEEFIAELYDGLEEILQREDQAYLEYFAARNVRSGLGQQARNLINHRTCELEYRGDDDLKCELTFLDNKIIRVSGRSLPAVPVIYLETKNVLDDLEGAVSKENDVRLRRYLRKEAENSEEESSYEEYHEIENNKKILEEIFEEVLHGKLQNTSDNMKYSEEGVDEFIGIRNVASGMKTMLMLRRLVENGTLREKSWLLIDEPESNLHPEWHLKLAEILTLMRAKMGVNILLSSHSPYFMRALEVKMAAYGMKEAGKFYLMEPRGNMYEPVDVTDNTEKIYSQLYRPLESL